MNVRHLAVFRLMQRDASLLIDAPDEAENNLASGESRSLGFNLRGCFTLRGRIHRSRNKAWLLK
jgi:hypothetical protein